MKPPIKKSKKAVPSNLMDKLAKAKMVKDQYSSGGYDPSKGNEYLMPKAEKAKKLAYAKADVRDIKKQIRKSKKK